MKLEKSRVIRIIKAALKEDIGTGDITTSALIGRFDSVKAGVFGHEDCVICGIDIAEWVLDSVDYSLRFKPQVKDGDSVSKGKEVAFIEGRARSILTAERTMLNFLGFLSGIATMTKRFVDIVKPYNVKIYDTRKTLPLLRYLEKYAVGVGGGCNHRMGLWDQALIKDNHLKIRSHAPNIISEARGRIQKNMKIEIEVGNIGEYEKAVKEEPDIIMLDNMSVGDIKKAVELKSQKPSRIELEASGGINLDNVEDYARTGVDRISIGSLTDSVSSVDMSLELID